jgi:hypothetical protein
MELESANHNITWASDDSSSPPVTLTHVILCFRQNQVGPDWPMLFIHLALELFEVFRNERWNQWWYNRWRLEPSGTLVVIGITNNGIAMPTGSVAGLQRL